MPPSSSKVISDYADTIMQYDPSKNITRNVLTRYEKTKIIGLRMEQLARGAHCYLEKPTLSMTLREIAMKELEQNKLPFMVVRILPNGEKEYWRLKDMMIF